MRLLLDTHILLWVLEADPQLSTEAEKLIRTATNEVYISAISLLEIAIKTKISKLNTQRTVGEIAREMTHVLAMQLLPVLPHHLDVYQSIPLYNDHRDPFDRLLVATALVEKLTLISADSKFERYNSLIALVQ